MRKLYIDFFSHLMLMSRVKQKFSGTNNGVNLIVLEIINSVYYGVNEIFLIAPQNFTPRDNNEKRIFSAEKIKKIYVNQLEDVIFEEDAALFIPMVCGRELIEATRIKRKNTNLKIYGRIHDKNHNFPLDLKDRYYYSGIKKLGIGICLDWIGKKLLFGIKYKSWIKSFDKIFTVSNFSMQKIVNKNVKFINYYYQGVLGDYSNSELYQRNTEEYILFVNGGRPEKNCLRAIEAFSLYKLNNKNDSVKLYITSTKKQEQECIKKYLKKRKIDIMDQIVFYEYLNYEELCELYTNSCFLFFASKGEGFGLPILESIMCGRPALASWSTSIPEVAYSSIRYFNPFDIDSMVKEIKYYRNEDNIRYYEECVKNRLEILKMQIKEDNKLLIRELFED